MEGECSTRGDDKKCKKKIVAKKPESKKTLERHSIDESIILNVP